MMRIIQDSGMKGKDMKSPGEEELVSNIFGRLDRLIKSAFVVSFVQVRRLIAVAEEELSILGERFGGNA